MSLEPVIVRAATIDELLSPDFTSGTAAGASSQRVDAWRRASTAGDDDLFRKRLARDGLTLDFVRDRLSDPVLQHSPQWAADAAWIQSSIATPPDGSHQTTPFAHVWLTVVEAAVSRMVDGLPSSAIERIAASARRDLADLLLSEICSLTAPVLYDRFRAAGGRYDPFVVDMTSGGVVALFVERPVLLRLLATLTRQWMDASSEFLLRLDPDLATLQRELGLGADPTVVRIIGGLSDRHRGGRSVLRVEFADSTRIMYKPKDIDVDGACHALVEQLNVDAPIDLRVPRVVPRDGYGWTEFVEHGGCEKPSQLDSYFRRAGGWLALLHCLAAGDVHQENLIAAGEHPVPVDLETVLQQPERIRSSDHSAHLAARELVSESVLSVGLLPTYGRAKNDEAYVIGGMASGWTQRDVVVWHDVNSDGMRPAKVTDLHQVTPNLPHVDGEYAQLGAHLDPLLTGFREYASYLAGRPGLLEGFRGLRVRRVIRPTQFYDLLLTRLRDDRKMRDGAIWSAQADFVARMADWDDDADPLWPMLSAERKALLQLDVPMFAVEATVGLQRADRRIRDLDGDEIDWQCDVIAQAATFEYHPAGDAPPSTHQLGPTSTREEIVRAADDAVATISGHAIRRFDGAAWAGLNWVGDSDIGQLAVLGHDMYSGTSGIAVALAAHAKVTGNVVSADLARASLTHLRSLLQGGNASHVARVMGIGGLSGLGSVCYALSLVSTLLGDPALRADAQRGAALITDDMINSDNRFDVVGGVAGAALGLLRLFRDDPDDRVLDTAVRCGEHLLTAEKSALHGMSHGAAGYRYALAALTVVTGRDEFADAAAGLAYDGGAAADHWRSQWCHGSIGVGLARLASGDTDIESELRAAERVWPGHVDTLCCGSLGNIELFREAGRRLGREDLRESASRRLSAVLSNADGYRWNGGATRFNLGLFRGLAGLAYTCLRELDDSLPNVLIFE